LPRKNQNSIIAPIRDDFFDIFADRSKVCPLSVALQQSLSLGDWVETLPRTANDNKNQSNQPNVL
jgi:hypothetical protein